MPPQPRPHILVVNGRKVRQPVFVIGAPHSGADILTRTLKRTPDFHFTVGQPSVLPVVLAFARTPSIQAGRGEATASVLRDSYGQAWQVSPHACLSCLPDCRKASPEPAGNLCIDERAIKRYGDATPGLIYCAEALVDAFPDARLVQIVRDGRGVAAAMLSDPDEVGWFRGGVANIDSEFPNPFYGVESEADKAEWAGLTDVGKCAMRWRGAVHKMARLRNALSADRLTTFRYEQMVQEPAATTAALAEFIDAEITGIEIPVTQRDPDGWRRLLNPAQLAEIDKVAGSQLRRVGYGA